MEKAKILIVEDEAIIALHIQKILEGKGYDILARVTSGEAAIDFVNGATPDCILMDIMLEGEIDGITAAIEVKKIADIPVIYVTAHSDEHTLERAKKTEPYGYILKPINNNDLISALEIAIYKHRIEKKLIENEEKYRSLIESINDIVFSTDENGVVTFISSQIEKMTGFSISEIIGKSFLSFVYNEDLEKIKDTFKKYQSGYKEPVEFRIKIESGKQKWINASPRPLLYNGRFEGLKGIITDIDDRKKAEESLKERTAELAEAQKLAKLGSWSWNMGENIFKMSEEMCDIYGADSTMSFTDIFSHLDIFIHPDDRGIIQDGIENLRQNKRENLIYRIVKKDGEVRWISALAPRVKSYDPEGNPEIIIGIVQDITEQKQAEQELKRKEENYKYIFNGINDGIVIHDLTTGTILDVNRAWLDMFEVTEDELPSTSFDELTFGEYPYTYNEALQLMKKAVKEGPQQFEWYSRTKRGKLFWVENTLKKITIGGTDCLMSVVRDITDRKKEKEELQKTQAILNAAIEQSPAGIIIADAPDATIRVANSSALGIRGESETLLTNIPVEHHPLHWQTFYPDGTPFEPEDLPLSQAVLYGKESQNVEVIIRRKSGEDRWVLANAAPILDQDGVINGGIVVFADVTDRKKTEKVLKKNEERLAFAVEASDEGLWDWNLLTNEVYYSPRWFTMLGYEPDETDNSFTIWTHLCHPDDLLLILNTIQNSIESKATEFKVEFRMKQKDGQWRWFCGKGKLAEFDEGGKPVRIVGTNVDIHEQKLVDEALRKSEEQFRAVFENAPIGIIIYSLSGRFMRINRYFYEMTEYSEEDLSNLNFMDITFEEDKKEIFRKFKKVISSKSVSESMEMRYVCKDGTTASAGTRLSLILNDKDEPEYVIGIIRQT